MLNKVSTENYEIVASGSLLTIKDEFFEIEFTNTSNINFKVRFSFLTDSHKGQKIESQPSSDGTYLNLFVYNASQTGGMNEPLKITNDASGKDLYLKLSFQQITASFTVTYTIFEKR